MPSDNLIKVGLGTTCCLIIAVIVLVFCSFTRVEQSEWALKYMYLTESVDDEPITEPGMQYIGLGNYLIRFPNTNKYCYFRSSFSSGVGGEGSIYNKAIEVRTNDGLAITLEFEFTYRLQPLNLYKLYMLTGDDEDGNLNYPSTLVHLSRGVISTWSTTFSAQAFYSDRGDVASTFKEHLKKVLSEKLYIDMESFQLQPAHFPDAYANAIVDTQEKKLDIQVAEQQKKTLEIQKQTQLRNQKEYAQKIQIDAAGEAESIEVQARASAAQVKYKQQALAEGYAETLKFFAAAQLGGSTNGMSNLLEYLKIEALKAYNGTTRTVRMSSVQ